MFNQIEDKDPNYFGIGGGSNGGSEFRYEEQLLYGPEALARALTEDYREVERQLQVGREDLLGPRKETVDHL